MRQLAEVAAIFVAIVFNSGCATLSDAQAAKGSGTAKVYDKPYDTVWNAVLQSVKSSDLKLVSENKDEGTVLAQREAGGFSWGENVAIFVEEADGKHRTRVEVVSKRTLAANITATNWENKILEDLDKRL